MTNSEHCEPTMDLEDSGIAALSVEERAVGRRSGIWVGTAAVLGIAAVLGGLTALRFPGASADGGDVPDHVIPAGEEPTAERALASGETAEAIVAPAVGFAGPAVAGRLSRGGWGAALASRRPAARRSRPRGSAAAEAAVDGDHVGVFPGFGVNAGLVEMSWAPEPVAAAMGRIEDVSVRHSPRRWHRRCRGHCGGRDRGPAVLGVRDAASKLQTNRLNRGTNLR